MRPLRLCAVRKSALCVVRVSALCVVLASVVLGAGAASAASVYVNSPLVTSYAPNATVGGFKYRISNGNFDLSLDSGTDTSGPAGSFLSAGLGNHSFLNGAAYDFTLQHVASEGFIVTMTRVGGGGSATLSWGTFTVAPGGTNAATLNGVAPGVAFNSIGLQAVASAGNRSAVLSNLTFTSGSVPVADGVFGATTTTNGNSPQTQLVVADDDLSLSSWTLGGRITLSKVGTGGDESVKLRLTFVDAAVTIVPEPTTAALVAVGLLGLLVAGRPRA
jgi:hypothetical protein